jgi:predicted permease
MANWWHVGGSYFVTMGVAIVSGRSFREGQEQPEAVVSETAARRLWPGQNPIGKRLRHPIDPDKNHWFSVIGVAQDVRDHRLDSEPSVVIYFPYWQAPCCRPHTEALTLVARSGAEPEVMAASIREQVWKVDRQVAVQEVRPMLRIVSASVAERRFQTAMLSVFALVALLLAAMGIYGVLAYTVAERRAEIGIRMALGARPSDVRSLILREGIRPVAIGLAVGMSGAGVLTRSIGTMLFGVRPLDPLTFAVVPTLLLLIAVLACDVPARGAAEIDPLEILRQQ